MDSRFSAQIVKFAFFGLIALILFIGLIGIKFLAVPFLVSGIQFYIFRGSVDSMESRGIPRAVTILFLFSFFLIIAYWVVTFYIPTVFQKAEPVIADWSIKMADPNFELLDYSKLPVVSQNPELWKKIINPEEIAKSANEYLDVFLKDLVLLIPTFLSWMIIIPIISFFLLLDAELIYKSLISLIPNRFFEMSLMVLFRMNEQVTNYLRSLLIQCGIMAIVSCIGFYLIGAKFFVLFGLFLGFANSIPYLGPLLGAIPPLAFAILFPEMSPGLGSIVLVVIFAQIVDNALVQPIVIANAVSLHPLFILVGIAVAGKFFGIMGMLLAIPVLSILKVTSSIFYDALKEHQLL